MNKIFFCFCLVFAFHSLCIAQTMKSDTIRSTSSLLEKRILRVNLLSPGVGAEFRTGNLTSLALSTGITFFPGIDGMNTDWKRGTSIGYSFEPFLGVDYKLFYNLEKRKQKGKNIAYNSANFVSLRSLTLGPPVSNTIVRQSNFDFLLFASWGIQRSYDRIHLLFDTGPVFVFDGKGNTGFFPLLFRINLGYNF